MLKQEIPFVKPGLVDKWLFIAVDSSFKRKSDFWRQIQQLCRHYVKGKFDNIWADKAFGLFSVGHCFFKVVGS